MKKNFFYATMSAIALTSAIGFTACSSDDAATDVNPTYDGNSVKTQFSISFPENVVSTRMTSTTVQAAQTLASFRGMTDIVLIPYSSATDRTTRLGNKITLAENTMIQPELNNASNAIPNGTTLATANNNAVLYKDVTIPVGTSGFLFYGKATGTDGYADGYLTPSAFTGESSTISFSPTPIVTTISKTKGDALATYVTSIAQAKDATDATITWAASDNAGLKQLYDNFTNLKAGASAYVQAVVQDLYSSIKNNTDKVSVAIKNAILNETYASVNTTTGKLDFTNTISDYPAGDNNFMPDGTAVLSWTESEGKKTATAVTNGSTVNNVEDMAKIVYPASLYYFANSGIKVSDASQQSEYTKTENDTWGKVLAKYTNGNSVTPTTRSVAITDQIQYAVGRLDVSVTALSKETYYDREGKEIVISDGTFTLNGVLIGGQKSVDYKFEPNGSIEYAIYDKTINGDNSASAVLSKTTPIGPTYTLALETAQNTSVYVALEFVNNSGKDFKGVDGIVKAGCKFYLVASLDPKADKSGEVDGVTSTDNKVFKQDFKTIANFTIGAGSPDGNHDGVSDTPGGFANAYTTIPDLRTPQLELGFSVDLTWQAGIQFDVTF